MTRVPIDIPAELVARSRAALIERVGVEIHAHLRRHFSKFNPDAVEWNLVARRTLICGTDRCVWLKKA